MIVTVKKAINIFLIILWSIIVLSITNSFEGLIFPLIILIFGFLFVINLGLLKKIKESRISGGYLPKEFKLLRTLLIIVNIIIFFFLSFILYKTSDIDKEVFNTYMKKNVCSVKKDNNIFKKSKKFIIDSYITDNEKCDFVVGYVSFDEGNDIIFNEITDSFKNGYNLKEDSFYKSGGGSKEVVMSGVFYDKKYNSVIFLKSNTIIYTLFREGYNKQVKKIMSDLGYTEKYKVKTLFIK